MRLWSTRSDRDLLAGAEESPGERVLYQGRTYKTYRGMGSMGAMAKEHGSRDRYFQQEVTELEKLVPEGIEGRVPYKGPVTAIVHQLLGGLRSSMGYCGAGDIERMRREGKQPQVDCAAEAEALSTGL